MDHAVGEGRGADLPLNGLVDNEVAIGAGAVRPVQQLALEVEEVAGEVELEFSDVGPAYRVAPGEMLRRDSRKTWPSATGSGNFSPVASGLRIQNSKAKEPPSRNGTR
jgi:hypothetical protein